MWQVAVNGQILGTMDREQIAASLQGGQLGPTAYVAGANLAQWTPIAEVPELARLIPLPAVPANMNNVPPVSPATPATGSGQGAAAYAGVGLRHAPEATPAPVSSATAHRPEGADPESGDWMKERAKGLKSIGVGILLMAINFATLWFLESFYPVTVIFSMGSFGYGGWVMVFGDEYHDRTLELQLWKRIGMWTFAGIGALLGLALCAFFIE